MEPVPQPIAVENGEEFHANGLWMGLSVCVLAAVPLGAQETRGNINGIVQDSGGVIPSAAVRITIRSFDLAYVHANIARTFNLGRRRTFQLRADIQNLLNRQHYANPEMDPTNTNFGQVRAVNNSVMRFFTFNAKFGF
jgi:hypothetical protein